MKVVACLSVFNNELCIRKTLDSIINHVDLAVILEGAYKNFPSMDTRSTDFTMEIVKEFQQRFPKKIIAVQLPRLSEIQKRNRFFDYLEVGDWMFVIDGDEFVIGDFQAAVNKIKNPGFEPPKVFHVQVLQMWLYPRQRITAAFRPRFFRVSEGMHYQGNHWTIVDGQGYVYNERAPHGKLSCFVIANCHFLYPAERQAQRNAYIKIMGAHGWKEESSL